MVRKTAKKKSKKKVAKKTGSARKSKSRRAAARPVAKKSARKAAPAAVRPQREHEGVWSKLFKRVKPMFSKPLDPRIKQLVEVFGEEAVRGLVGAYRKSRETAQMELEDAMARAEAMKPPPVHGSWAWHELMTRDVGRAKQFYCELFGWEPYDIEMMPGFNYTILRQQGKDAGGMMAIGPEHGDMPPGWSVYVTVDDVDAAADRAEMLGGEILVPPHDIPVGRWALIKDPTGATICLWKPKM
jgi:predicted enzyme related to lactoylglutathione lyase